MDISNLISHHVIEVYDGGNWTDVDFAATINDVSFDEAVQVTPASPNTIASILYHVKFYNEVIMQRLNGIAPEISDANGFDMPPLENENDWKKLVDDVGQSFTRLADQTKNFPEERLGEMSPSGGSSYYKTLHGICEHAYYHLGQIVILKKFLRRKNA